MICITVVLLVAIVTGLKVVKKETVIILEAVVTEETEVELVKIVGIFRYSRINKCNSRNRIFTPSLTPWL